MKFGTELEIIELVHRALQDNVPISADAVYLFGETPDNERSVIQRGTNLYSNKTVSLVALLERIQVPNRENQTPSWISSLEESGVKTADICVIPVPEDWSFDHGHPGTWPLNTNTEIVVAVRYAKKLGWKRLCVTAAPFHMVRTFVNTVTVALREYPELLVYSLSGKPLPWTEHVVHSMGVVTGARFELVASEIKRINRYHLKGDLASAREVLDYLNQRDQRA